MIHNIVQLSNMTNKLLRKNKRILCSTQHKRGCFIHNDNNIMWNTEQILCNDFSFSPLVSPPCRGGGAWVS